MDSGIFGRFWDKVNKNGPIPKHCPNLGPCWAWTASKDKQGYGRFQVDYKTVKAHRWIWQKTNGEVPIQQKVCHKCDNTSCVRPSHLYIGTQKDNIQDAVKKGRMALGVRNGSLRHPESRPKGSNNKNSKLNEVEVLEIKAAYKMGFKATELAKVYRVSLSTVYNISSYGHWKHLGEGTMRRVTPKVFLVGSTSIEEQGMADYLSHVGAPEWTSDAPSDPEKLTEFMGRLCYRSWREGMNTNVIKVRKGNYEYLNNVIESRHGALFEHATTNWVLADVSRVFTHELVRHRAGVAYSQESLRFVRLTDLGLWIPNEEQAPSWLVSLFEKTFKNLEEIQFMMSMDLGLDKDLKFKDKKIWTSLMRRIAPLGLATTIGASFNFRALRHVIELRTSETAEAEMRFVFSEVAKICKKKWPNIFADFSQNESGEWVTENRKI